MAALEGTVPELWRYGGVVRLRKTVYQPWEGQRMEDFKRCLSCRWHGVMNGNHICCDYSQVETHGPRLCPQGEACTKYEPSSRAKSEMQKHRLRGIERNRERIRREKGNDTPGV